MDIHQKRARHINRNKTEVESVQLGYTYIAYMVKCPQDKCCPENCCGDSCNLLYMFPGPFVKRLIQIGPVTAEILLTLSLCGGWVVGGGGCKVFFV